MEKSLIEALKNADGIIVIISEESIKSHYVVSEIGTARAYVAESANKKFIIPIIYGDIAIPSFINDLHCVRLNSSNIDDSIRKINTSIYNFIWSK